MSTSRIHQPVLAGVAEARITPSLPCSLAGYFNIRIARRVRDDLYCRACVLRSGKQGIALVACDLVAVPGSLVNAVRDGVNRRLNSGKLACMIAATHTHSGPDVSEIFSSHPSSAYMNRLERVMIDVIVTAFESAAPARVGIGTGHEDTTAFHRRFLMRDGSIKTNPGVLNPDIVLPAGPIDPEVGILKVTDLSGKPLAAVVNFTNHVDVLGLTEVSADWPGVMARRLKRDLGAGLVPLYLNGAEGNINHVNVDRRAAFMGPGMISRIGNTVAGAVLNAWDRIHTAPSVPLASWSRIVALPRKPISKSDMAQARHLLAGLRLPYRVRQNLTAFDLAAGNPIVERLFAQELLALAKLPGRADRAELQAIRIGDSAWVGIPGEIFVEIGLAIKKASPFRDTFIVGLCNDALGYMPTDIALKAGGYESKTARSSRVGPGTEARLIQESLKLLKAVRSH